MTNYQLRPSTKNTSKSLKGRKWTLELQKTSKMRLMSNLFKRLAMSMFRVSCRKLAEILPTKKRSRTLNSSWMRRVKSRRNKLRKRRKNNRMVISSQSSNIRLNINKIHNKFYLPLMPRHPKLRKPKVWPNNQPVTINYNQRSFKTPSLRSNHYRKRVQLKSRRKSSSNYKRSNSHKISLLYNWWKRNHKSSAPSKLN